CGPPAPARGGTVVEPLPPSETGPVPVHFDAVTARWFGVPPAAVLLGLAGCALLAAVVLSATGRWPLGLVCVGLALLLLAAFGEAAKRKPDTRFAERSFEALRAARAHAGVAVESAAARTRAQREIRAARQELLGIQQLRREEVTQLGEGALVGR